MADAQEVALSDEEVFGPSRSVDMSPLEKAFEQIAEGSRSSSLGAAKATIEEAAARFEKVTAAIREQNTEAVTQAVEAALEKITKGARVDTSAIREIVGGIKMPDLSGIEAIRAELERVGKLVEGTHGAIAGSIRTLREEFLAAMRDELKAATKAAPAQEKRPVEWHFDVQYDDPDDREKPTGIVARAGGATPTPTSVLEAVRIAMVK